MVDRSIKIAMTTCEQIIRKDFALDSEESRMRLAAHHMMRNLTAGMAMITCREPLLMSIATNLKNSFAAALRVSCWMCIHPIIASLCVLVVLLCCTLIHHQKQASSHCYKCWFSYRGTYYYYGIWLNPGGLPSVLLLLLLSLVLLLVHSTAICVSIIATITTPKNSQCCPDQLPLKTNMDQTRWLWKGMNRWVAVECGRAPHSAATRLFMVNSSIPILTIRDTPTH